MERTPILPASAPLGTPERFLPTAAGIEPIAAVACALSGFNRDQLGSAIEVLIALMDVTDGDPEAENATDAEDDFALSPDAIELATKMPRLDPIDEDAGAYVEWTTMRGSQKGGQCLLAGHEDDEDGDVDEDDDSDTGIDDDPRGFDPEEDWGAEEIGEREQMSDDVPMLPVFTAEHNVFNDERTYLGRSNLQSSFRTNGSEVRSADTGAVLVTTAKDDENKSGVPV